MESNSRPPTMPQSRKPPGCLAYAIGSASFIPLVGVPFGIIAIVLGITRKTRAMVVLGASGILFGVVFYLGMFWRGGIYGRLRRELAVYALNGAVMDIEFYKRQHGRYPASIGEVEPKGKTRLDNFIDPTSTPRGGTLNGRFYYQLDPSGNFYYLRSVGPDGIPFTGDDILPALSEDEKKNTGLRLQR